MPIEWPKISVVTPCFNHARFLEATLRSVWNQDCPNLDHIVIDGGSTDGSLNIIRRYSERLAYWVSEPDRGHIDAYIKGFDRATGDIMCWLNSDDLFEPWTLREVAQFFIDNSQARVVYGDATWIDIDGKPIKPKKEHAFNRFIWTYDYNFIPQPSTFWRRDLYEEVGGLNPRFQLAMDADLWIRFADVTRIHHVRRPWSRMRLHPLNINRVRRAESDREDLIIRRRYIGDEREWSLKAKKVVAKSVRVSWKLLTGCYW